MAQDTARTFTEFISKFPLGGTATASYSAAEGNQQIGLQVKLPSERILTYVQKLDNQSHAVIKRLAEGYIAELDGANLNHDPLTDVTPEDEKEDDTSLA